MLWFWILGLHFEGEIFGDNYFRGFVEVASKIVNIWSSNLHGRAIIGLLGFIMGGVVYFKGQMFVSKISENPKKLGPSMSSFL